MLAISKSIAVALVVIALHRALYTLGPARLIIDMLAYAALALAVRVLRFGEVISVIKLVRRERAAKAA